MSRPRLFVVVAALAVGLLSPSATWEPSETRAPALALLSPPPPPFATEDDAPATTGSLNPRSEEPRARAAPDPILASLRRYAPVDSLAPIDAEQLPLALDVDAAREAIALYRRGDLAGGDLLARRLGDPHLRLALEWAALRLQPRPAGLARLRAFLVRAPDWPSAPWIERQIETALYAERKAPAEIFAAFRDRKPETTFGALALARAETAEGRDAQAAERVRKVWREDELSDAMEQQFVQEFGRFLTKADHKARSDRFFYDEKDAASARAALAAGPDVVKLAQARAAVGSARGAALAAALPKELQSDPTLIFARAQSARRADKLDDAAALIEGAPRVAEALVDGDAWWAERRLLARKLLDRGDGARAYRLAAEHSAVSAKARVEAEFHAGWIALRHQERTAERAGVAKTHFDRALAAATTPAGVARAAYWQGRAAESLGDVAGAQAAYAVAAAKVATFYGQLARARVGLEGARLNQASPASTPSAFVRVFRLLYAAGERTLALPLAIDAAREGGRDEELASLSLWLAERRDAAAALAIGKTGHGRGGALEETAFPLFGVPAYDALPASAETALVYSIARQESAFRADAVSSAGAKGLMQMLPSTARETARRAGVSFDERRLLTDPAFNAQLGAAHLGELLTAQQGSYILTFAAYNAGPGRVKQWLAAYGDPRDPQVDPIDWIERIPFSETRDYVQKILENLQIYRVRLGQSDGVSLGEDLRRVRRAAIVAP